MLMSAKGKTEKDSEKKPRKNTGSKAGTRIVSKPVHLRETIRQKNQRGGPKGRQETNKKSAPWGSYVKGAQGGKSGGQNDPAAKTAAQGRKKELTAGGTVKANQIRITVGTVKCK